MPCADLGNGGGDLIGGLVTGGVGGPWLRPGLEDTRGKTREGDTVLHHSLRGRGNMESPCNGVHCFIKIQEILSQNY